MKHVKHLGISFLIAWIAAWIFTTMTLAVISASKFSDIMPLVAFYSIFCCIGTLLVVGVTWLVVATPYYYFCLRRHESPLAHHLAGTGLAIAITRLVTGGDPGIWPYMAAIAVLTSIVGVQTLLRLRSTRPKAL